MKRYVCVCVWSICLLLLMKFSILADAIVQRVESKVMDELNQGIPYASFSLYMYGEWIQNVVSDDEGNLIIEDIRAGYYQLKDNQNDMKYEKMPEVLTFEVSETGEETIYLSSIVKKRKLGSLVIQLQNHKQRSLAYLHLQLLNENKEWIQDISSDASGKLFLKNLPLGTYYLLPGMYDDIEDYKKELSFSITSANYNKNYDITIIIEDETMQKEGMQALCSMLIVFALIAFVYLLRCYLIKDYFCSELEDEM